MNKDVKLSITILLDLLNSNILDFSLKQISTTFRGGYMALNRQYIEKLPIRTINFDDTTDVALHDRMVTFVEQMLQLNKELADVKLPNEKERIQRQIDATDKQIDKLVYELYDLTMRRLKF